jgi:hypothetical protein
MARPKGSKNKPKEEVPEIENKEQKFGDEPESNAPPHFKSRLALINDVNSINKERAASEDDADLVEEVDLDSEEDTESEETVEEAEVEAAPKASEPVKKKLKIDGKEIELTEQEIIELAQKNGAADSRLAEANRILEDAKRRTATREDAQSYAATQQNGQHRNPPSGHSSSQPDADEEVFNRRVSEVTNSLIYGDEEKVRKVVTEILGNGRQKATQNEVDPQAIRTYVSETLAFERGKQLLETPAEQGGFSDVWDDPVMRSRFQQREHELRESGDNRPYAELYKSIGTEIREWRDELVKKYVPPSGLENRDASKRATGVVRGAGGKLPSAPLEAKPKSHDEKLDGMRRSRGQLIN